MELIVGLCCVPVGPGGLGKVAGVTVGGVNGREAGARALSGGWRCNPGRHCPVSLWTASRAKWPEPRVAAWGWRG